MTRFLFGFAASTGYDIMWWLWSLYKILYTVTCVASSPSIKWLLSDRFTEPYWIAFCDR